MSRLPVCILFSVLFTPLLLWLALPGGGEFWPLLFVALVPFLFTLVGGSNKRAMFMGLGCGLVHFTALLYWIVIVLGTYGGLVWFVSLLALLLLALYLSCYTAFFALLTRYLLLSFPPALSLWLVPALWVGLDWLRGLLFTGFPWMDLGYGLYKIPLLIQMADLFGHHGLTFVLVFCNCLFLLLLTRKQTWKGVLLTVLPALCLLFVLGSYSKIRFDQVRQEVGAASRSTINAAIVQGNIDQSLKWSPAQQQKTVEKYQKLVESLFTKGHPELVVWPETALPFYPPANEHMGPLQKLVTSNDFTLLTGAPWYDIIDRKARKIKFYNSAMLLSSGGEVSGTYFKTHLVPFGEYIPLKKYLPFLAPLVEAVGDFSRGTVDKPLVSGEARIGVLICFESVFPELSRKWMLAGANVLVNLTNDAWYGKSSAPHHSLAMSVVRAVEARRSLIRSANTGISAFVSPLGEVTSQSEIFVPWAEAADVVLFDQLTFWARFGYLFAPLCLVLGLAGGLYAGRLRGWA